MCVKRNDGWSDRDRKRERENVPVFDGSENTNFRGSITVQLTSCLSCKDSAALLLLNEQKFYSFGQILTSQTRGQQDSETSPLR